MSLKEHLKSFATGAAAAGAALSLPFGAILGLTVLLGAAAGGGAAIGFMAFLGAGAGLGIKISHGGWNTKKPSFLAGLAAASVALGGLSYSMQDTLKSWASPERKPLISQLDNGRLGTAFAEARAPRVPYERVSARPQPVFAPARL